MRALLFAFQISQKNHMFVGVTLGFFVMKVDAVQCKCTQSVLYYWRCAVYCHVLSRCSFYERFKWTAVFVQGREKIMRGSRAFTRFHWFIPLRTWIHSVCALWCHNVEDFLYSLCAVEHKCVNLKCAWECVCRCVTSQNVWLCCLRAGELCVRFWSSGGDMKY